MPTIVYYKPGAMGKGNLQRKRLSHIEIVLDRREIKNKRAIKNENNVNEKN